MVNQRGNANFDLNINTVINMRHLKILILKSGAVHAIMIR